jgi:hypothetical protein
VGIPVELRSALITSFSLSLLLRTDALWLYALAAVIAVGSKFLIRIDGKHVFNPATIAIVALVFGSGRAWSRRAVGRGAVVRDPARLPRHHGAAAARRADVTLFLPGRPRRAAGGAGAWLGDPLAIPCTNSRARLAPAVRLLHDLDPKTIPDSRLGRLIFACAVAGLAHYLHLLRAGAAGALPRPGPARAHRVAHRQAFAGAPPSMVPAPSPGGQT